MKAILGKKIGMTQIFTETGEVVPVTVIEAGPNVVTQIKTVETDGYNAVQIGFEDLKESRANKPAKGHFAKWQAPLKKYLREVRVDDIDNYKPGQVITVADFEEGKKIGYNRDIKRKRYPGSYQEMGTGKRAYEPRFQASQISGCSGSRDLSFQSI